MDPALRTQVENLQKRSGHTLEELFGVLEGTGLEKHGQLRDHLKAELGMGHGDANTVVTLFRKRGEAPASDDPLDAIYVGPKEALRPIHEAVMARVDALGSFEIAPKKAYVSLRRKKQFAMVGPATKTQVEIGLNAKELEGSARLKEQKPGGMCQYKVRLSDPSEVDDELVAWLKTAFEAAG
ncbi:MAG: DUF5655 domain-containing protein [Gemmatimonadota bacterium]